MLQETRGIVLRSIRYGETSLISSIFTEHLGVQSYLIKGVRTARSKSNKAALLQPATLLEIVAYQNVQKNLQHLRDFHSAYIYETLQEQVIKNSIALFSAELLLRLLPEHAPMPELFRFSFGYFVTLDKLPDVQVANFPLFFAVHCARLLGYELSGNYSTSTPHLNLHEGGFTAQTPDPATYVSDEEAAALAALLKIEDPLQLHALQMNANMRHRLLDWYIEFLHRHTQHLSEIKSLAVLRAVLH